jgi:hypothetical protein
MGDQWDPKYPASLPLWYNDYVIARGTIYVDGSSWRRAFAAVVDAEAAGLLQTPKELYRDAPNQWAWWGGLWNHYVAMFQASGSPWPEYARIVFEAVPDGWLKGTGRIEGIPTDWTEKRLIWGFKSTVLFVAGLIEGALLPAPERVAQEVEKLVEQQLAGTLQPLVARVDGIDRRVQGVQSTLQPFVGQLDSIDRLVRERVDARMGPLLKHVEKLGKDPL